MKWQQLKKVQRQRQSQWIVNKRVKCWEPDGGVWRNWSPLESRLGIEASVENSLGEMKKLGCSRGFGRAAATRRLHFIAAWLSLLIFADFFGVFGVMKTLKLVQDWDFANWVSARGSESLRRRLKSRKFQLDP